MRPSQKDLDKLEAILKSSCTQKTSYRPKGWKKEYPLYGHCTVISLLVQDFFGGELVRGPAKVPGYKNLRFHYWNRLPDGREVDLSRDQFPKESPASDALERLVYPSGEIRRRSRLMSIESVVDRYNLLKKRVSSLYTP